MADLKLEDGPLTPETALKAEKELRETPEVVEKALQEFRTLLQKSNIAIPLRDDILIRYLRPTKFYPESALKLLKKCCEFKKKYEVVLNNLLPITVKEAMFNSDCVNVFKGRDQFGRRILLAKVGAPWDTSVLSGDQVFQIFYLIHQAALLEENTQVNGVVVILDFNGLGMKQVKELTPSFSLRLLSFIQDAMPLRLKEVHIVNQPFLFNMVWTIFKPFIQDKLSHRLFFHGHKMQSLHKHLDPEFIPSNYGGKLPEINYSSSNWYPILEGLNSVIQENNSIQLK